MGTLQTTIVPRINPLTGDKKLYAGIATYSNVNSKDLIDRMMRNSGITRAAAAGAVHALTKLIRNYALNGHSVRIPGLGLFSVTLTTKAVETAKKLNRAGQTVQRVKLRFTPIQQVQTAAKSVKFRGVLPEWEGIDTVN